MCNLCGLQNSKANVTVENERLVITFRYKSDAASSAEFLEHIVGELCFDHDDGNFELITKNQDGENCFQISILSCDDPAWLANEVSRQVQKAIENWEARPRKFICA
jgi:hypothetical protein